MEHSSSRRRLLRPCGEDRLRWNFPRRTFQATQRLLNQSVSVLSSVERGSEEIIEARSWPGLQEHVEINTYIPSKFQVPIIFERRTSYVRRPEIHTPLSETGLSMISAVHAKVQPACPSSRGYRRVPSREPTPSQGRIREHNSTT